MSKTDCPKLEKCPIFQKDVLHNEMIGKTYRNLYCQTENKNYLNCKRYIVSEKYGKPAPEKILPNSALTVEEIAKHAGFI